LSKRMRIACGVPLAQLGLDVFAGCKYYGLWPQSLPMHINSRRSIDAARQRHPTARSWLDTWWRVASKSRWTSLTDVRCSYRDTDEVGQCLVFDVRGNDFRLICRMTYANRWTDGTLLVKHFLTHAEYDKNKWCKDCAPQKGKS